MKKLSIPCSFGAQNHPVDFYVGQPKRDKHPIQNQSTWLSSARGGSVPGNVMQSLEKLHELSRTNKVNFAELCEYAINTAESSDDSGSDDRGVQDRGAEVDPALDYTPVSEPIPAEAPVITSVPEVVPVDTLDLDLDKTLALEPVPAESPVAASVPEDEVSLESGSSKVDQATTSFSLSHQGKANVGSNSGKSGDDESNSHLTDQDIEDFLNN